MGKTWQMQFNIKKYYAMSITHKHVFPLLGHTMNKSTLEHVKNYPYLEVSLAVQLLLFVYMLIAPGRRGRGNLHRISCRYSV